MLGKIIAIIRKDIALRFETRIELLFFLALPVVFTLIAGGFPDVGGDGRVRLAIVDEDRGQPAATLVAALDQSLVVRAKPAVRAAAEALLRDGDAGAILIIPAGFSDEPAAGAALAGHEAELILRAAPNSDAGLVVGQEIRRAIRPMIQPLQAARGATRALDAARPFPDGDARAAFFNSVYAAATAEHAGQPARVTYTTLSDDSDGGAYNPRAQASAGQLITWVFIPLLGASGLFAMERALGTLRRLVTTPTSKATFLLGAIAGQLLIALAQMALLIAFGMWVMRVPWGDDPLALAGVLVAFGLAGVALGTMLGTFVRTESQAGNLSIMLGMAMALLGGCWWPMELFPPALQQAVKVLPTTWAMRALTDLSMRGQGLAGVLPEIGVLLGFAAVFFVVGVWRFKYE